MKEPMLILYRWPTLPFLLTSLWLACAGIGNAAQENTLITSISPVTTHSMRIHSKRTTPEPWLPFVSQTPSKVKAKEGETVVLGCQYHSPQGPSLNNLTMKWYKEDEKGQKDLVENNVTVVANNTRIFMIWNLTKGSSSLTIVNVTTGDHGTYFCRVILHTGDAVTGDGTKLRIQRALGFFGIEDSIGTIIGVLAASIGGLIVLILVLAPYLRKCLPCAKGTSQQA